MSVALGTCGIGYNEGVEIGTDDVRMRLYVFCGDVFDVDGQIGVFGSCWGWATLCCIDCGEWRATCPVWKLGYN